MFQPLSVFLSTEIFMKVDPCDFKIPASFEIPAILSPLFGFICCSDPNALGWSVVGYSQLHWLIGEFQVKSRASARK